MAWTHGTLMLDSSPLAEFVSATWKGIDVPAGAELLRQGDGAGVAFLVTAGLAKLWRSNADGRVAILGLRGPGWLLGFAPAILGTPSLATATVLTRCRVHAVRSDELRKCLQGDPRIALGAIEMLSREVQEQFADRAEDRMSSAGARLEQLLWSLSAEAGTTESAHALNLALPLRLGELAQLLSVTPQYLSGLLRNLRSRGIVRKSHGTLVISHPDRLRHHPDE